MKRGALVLTVALVLLAPLSHAELFSKTYVFKANTTLEVGEELQEGIRVDSITLNVPEGRFGSPVAAIAISNLGARSARVGIAVALVDDDNKLVGVASGGTRLFPLRPERQMVYKVPFHHVNGDVARASVFMLAIEPNP